MMREPLGMFTSPRLTADERLCFHQEHSRAVMEALEAWMKAQLDEHLTEPNSGLGQAIATQLGGKLRQPSFQSGADFAIVHRGRLRQTDFLGGKSLLPRIAPFPLSCRDNPLMQSPLRNVTVKIWGKSCYVGTEGSFSMKAPVTPGPGAGILLTASYTRPDAETPGQQIVRGEDTIVVEGK